MSKFMMTKWWWKQGWWKGWLREQMFGWEVVVVAVMWTSIIAFYVIMLGSLEVKEQRLKAQLKLKEKHVMSKHMIDGFKKVNINSDHKIEYGGLVSIHPDNITYIEHAQDGVVIVHLTGGDSVAINATVQKLSERMREAYE